MAATIQTIEKPTKARALDTSGNNNHGQIYSGRALEFDGVSDYLSVNAEVANHADVFGAYLKTFACWFKVDNSATEGVISAGWLSTNSIGIKAGVIQTSSFDGGDDVKGNTAIDSNTWYRLAVISNVDQSDNTAVDAAYADGFSHYSIYLNGVKQTLSAGDFFRVGGDMLIGARFLSTFSVHFAGKMSDIQGWDTAWTADDALFDYQNPEQLALNRGGTSLTNSNLKIWYPMNDGHRGQQSYVLDASNTGLGDELLTNGDFSDASVPATWNGSAEVDSLVGWVNSTLAHNATDYFEIVNGQCIVKADGTGDLYIKQSILVEGVTYKVSVEITDYTKGALNIYNNSIRGSISEVGTLEFTFTAGSATTFVIDPSGDCLFTIDNISCKPINNKNHATTVFYGDELVTNGDFEAGDATINSVTRNLSDATSFGASTDVANGGSKSGKLTADSSSSNPAVEWRDGSNMGLIAGRTYKVSADVYITASQELDLVTMQVIANNGSSYLVSTATSAAVGSWVTLTGTFVDDDITKIKFIGNKNGGGAVNDEIMYIDNLSIKEVGLATGWTDADQQLDIPQTALQSYNQLAWFSRGGDQVSITDNNALSFTNDSTDSPFSISGWIYVADRDTHSYIFIKGGHATYNKYEYDFFVKSDGNLQFACYDGATADSGSNSAVYAGRITNNTPISMGKWYHVVATYDGGDDPHDDAKLYINGEEASHVSQTSGSYEFMKNQSITAMIGRRGLSGAYGDVSCVTEVSVWNSELTQTEINELYNDGKALDATTHSRAISASTNLKGYWRNNGLATWTDLSEDYSNNGTVTTVTETMLITAGADGSRDSQGFLMNRQRATNSLNTNEEAYTSVAINHTFGTADFSYGFWFKLEDTENGYLVGVQSIGNSTGVGLTIDVGDGKIRSRPFGVTAVYTSAAYDDGEWHYAHHNIDRSANAILYIDKTAVLTQDISGVTGNVLSTNSWNIGAESGTSTFLAGEIDDLIIYSSKLSFAQIKRNYNAGKRSHR